MGINSSNVAAGDGSILPHGFTITEYGRSNENYMPNLFLGDLRSLNQASNNRYEGYGLYADNVYLNGSLTTKSSDTGKYAGVNTLSGIQGATDIIGTNSNIIFWAGANGTSIEAI
jgi:hypothetical protein